MTRWVRCGSSQKHKKMPGDATKWGEFDNQHAREIPLKKKKNIQSQTDINKKVKALPSTTLFHKAEESLDEDFFEQDKYCLTENSNEINEQENSTFDESHSNISLSKNKEDFSTNRMHDSKIKKKKKRNNFDIEYSSLGGNSDGIDLNEINEQENSTFDESHSNISLSKNKEDFSTNRMHDSKIKKKKKQNNFDIEYSSLGGNSDGIDLNGINEQENSTFDESHSNISLSKNKEDFSTNRMHDSKIKKQKKRNNFDIEYSSLGGNSDGIDLNEINEQENSTFDESHSNISLSKNKEDFSTNRMHDSKIKKKKKRNNFDIEYSSLGGNSDGIDSNEVAIRRKKIKLENDCSIVTENNKVLEQANNHSDFVENSRIPEESFSQKQDKKKRKKEKRYNQADSESFSTNDGTMETSFENSNEKQEDECIISPDKAIEPVQSLQDIDRSAKKKKVKKYSKMNSDLNQSSVNNESCKNSSSKVENMKEMRLKKLKEKREELGLIQLPHNVENKLRKIKKRLMEKGFPPEKLKEILRQERRREELQYRKVYNPHKLCFGCREPGHVLADCPTKSESETGICFKCGSVEHTSYKCPEKIQGFPYAKCFICKEQGHISRHCPQNKRGVYPKGGRCNLCGNVNHLRKDCPTLKKKENEEEDITLPTLNEDVSVDAEVVKKEEIKRKSHKKSKVVKF